jgi:phosphatidylinositol-3-phosphatase
MMRRLLLLALLPLAFLATPPVQAVTHPSKLLVVVEENHSFTQAKAGMPYLWSLAQKYGYASNYHAVTHPSLPNYLAIAGGSTFGVSDDQPPSAHPISGLSVFDQALATGHSARSYEESMPSNCDLSAASPYAVKHNPWAYFVDERSACASYDVPLGTASSGALKSDITAGTLPNAGMIIPNLDNDAHDGSLAAADSWLQVWLPKILAGADYKAGRLAVVVTFDEPGTVLTVVMAPGVSHKVVSTSLTHYSTTRLYDEILGASLLGNASSANSMRSAFGI